jgi:hypothetical protein
MIRLMLTTAQRRGRLIFSRRAARGTARSRLPNRTAERVEDALAIQRVRALLGVATGGWKCSLPTPERALVRGDLRAQRGPKLAMPGRGPWNDSTDRA